MIKRSAVCHKKHRGAEARPQYNKDTNNFLTVRQTGLMTAHGTLKRQSCTPEPEIGLVGQVDLPIGRWVASESG
eukprot:14513926-Heterocapsa_arctica.AAC.1